jgi:hypothetical protein
MSSSSSSSSISSSLGVHFDALDMLGGVVASGEEMGTCEWQGGGVGRRVS